MKKFFITFTLAIVITIQCLIQIQAQPIFDECASGISAVNLHDETIEIRASYWSNIGSNIFELPPKLVDPLESEIYFNEPTILFQGSAILTSNDGRLGAYTNESCQNGQRGAAYDGVEKPTNNAFYPIVLNDFFGQTVFLSVQNTDTTQAVSTDFIFTEQGGTTFTKTFTIQAGRTKFYDPSKDLTFPSPWIGSAIVKGSGNIAGIGINYTDINMGMYTALNESDKKFYLPLIRSNFGGYTTGSQVGSISTITRTVVMTYSGDIYNSVFVVLYPDYDCVIEATVPPQSSLNFFNGFTTPFTDVIGSISATKIAGDCFDNNDLNFSESFIGADKFLGGGTATSDGEIVAIVNDIGTDVGINSAGIYNGFMTENGSDYIISPLSRVEFGGAITGHQIQNICSYSVTVDFLYIANNDFMPDPPPPTPPANSFVIQPGKSVTAFIAQGTGYDGWIGTFTAKTQGGEQCLVGITNDQVDGFDNSVFNLIEINK